MKTNTGFSTLQLAILFRLLPGQERSLALNLRGHNPRDVDLVIEAQKSVDDILGINSDPGFRVTDDIESATRKASRYILASHVKEILVGRWFYSEVGGKPWSQLTGYLDDVYLRRRFVRLIPISFLQFMVLSSFLLLRRPKRLSEIIFCEIIACFRFVRARSEQGVRKSGNRGRVLAESSNEATSVVILMNSPHRPVTDTAKSIASSLMDKGFSPVLVFWDGFDPKQSLLTNPYWKWCEGLTCLALNNRTSYLSTYLSLLTSGRGIISVIRCIAIVSFRILSSKSSDWIVKSILVRKLPGLIADFHVSLSSARSLLSHIKPRSVISCGGSEKLHVKSWTYESVKHDIHFYRYQPAPGFPVSQPEFSSAIKHMLVTPDDEPRFQQEGVECQFWHVGSPLLDQAAPYVSGQFASLPRSRSASKGRKLSVLCFTKRNFPNARVISGIAGHCQSNRIPADILVKPHPSDYSDLSSEEFGFDDSITITYFGKDQIDHVDRLISEVDVVITGPSAVIWSAFAQYKPVVFVATATMSSDDHVLGYSKYATSDLVFVSHVDEIGDRIGPIMDKIHSGHTPRNHDRHSALMRNFFCDGEFNSSERISRVLIGEAGY